jgi:hypothetical protein
VAAQHGLSYEELSNGLLPPSTPPGFVIVPSDQRGRLSRDGERER